MKPRQLKTILWASLIFSALKLCDSLNNYHVDQTQHTFLIDGEYGGGEGGGGGERVKREAGADPETKMNLTSVFHLNNSHLHLMVHWAGKGSSVVFCLTRDPVSQVVEIFHHRLFLFLSSPGYKGQFYLTFLHLPRLRDVIHRYQLQVHLDARE